MSNEFSNGKLQVSSFTTNYSDMERVMCCRVVSMGKFNSVQNKNLRRKDRKKASSSAFLQKATLSGI